MLEGEGCDVGVRHQEYRLVVVADRQYRVRGHGTGGANNNSGVGEYYTSGKPAKELEEVLIYFRSSCREKPERSNTAKLTLKTSVYTVTYSCICNTWSIVECYSEIHLTARPQFYLELFLLPRFRETKL